MRRVLSARRRGPGRCGALLVLLVLAIGPVAQGQAPPPRGVLYLQPLGDALPEADVQLVVTALREFYGLVIRILPRVALPAASYYPARQRYRAEKLLDYLAPRLPKDGERVLGLTAVDISTTKDKYYDWGVMGLGSLDGAAGVLSSFRCHKQAHSAEHARQRLAKVAVHELGHTLGLPHCATPGCLMHDGEGQVKTTDTEYDLCSKCRAQLATLGRPALPAPHIPWPRPPGPDNP